MPPTMEAAFTGGLIVIAAIPSPSRAFAAASAASKA